MPQMQLPIFPAGVTEINSRVAVEARDGQVCYVRAHRVELAGEQKVSSPPQPRRGGCAANKEGAKPPRSRADGVVLVHDRFFC
jgi:hypothetical protein